MKTIFRAYRSPWRDSWEFVVGQRSFDKDYIAKPLELVAIEKGTPIEQPTFTIPMEDRHGLQMFFDELYSLGFRPTAAQTEPGTVQALQGHLEDMRKLVFSPPQHFTWVTNMVTERKQD